MNTERAYNSLTFEEIGFDMVVIDEAHYYKNLYLPGKAGQTKGMQPQPANKTFDLLMKLQYVSGMNNGKRGGYIRYWYTNIKQYV